MIEEDALIISRSIRRPQRLTNRNNTFLNAFHHIDKIWQVNIWCTGELIASIRCSQLVNSHQIIRVTLQWLTANDIISDASILLPFEDIHPSDIHIIAPLTLSFADALHVP